MDDNDITKLVKIAILIMLAKREKTVSPSTIQTAVRIIYVDNDELCRQLINSGTRYCTKYTENPKIKLNSFTYCDNLTREHIRSGIYNEIYKISSRTIPYLCGVFDKANNQVQQL